jgi:hypothetical protein
MTLSEPEIKRWETLIAEFLERRRPPPRLRKDVDLSSRIKRQSVEIFEIRSHWTGNPVADLQISDAKSLCRHLRSICDEDRCPIQKVLLSDCFGVNQGFQNISRYNYICCPAVNCSI